MDWPTGPFDIFRVEETYNWRDDVMEITRRIVHETDEARLSNIANHFEVDLSEIRAFLEMKQQQQRKPMTWGDKIRAMTDEELADLISERIDCSECEHMYVGEGKPCHNGKTCPDYWLDWLRKEATDG
jgi:hypothetical protein